MIFKERALSTLTLLLLISFIGISQEKQLKRGNEAFANLAYPKAIKLYKEALKKGHESKEVYENLADSYYYISELEKAVFWYKKLIVNYQGDINPEHIDRYAASLMTINEYDKANEIRGQQSKNHESVSKEPSLTYLDTIENLSGRFTLDTLNINSKYSDYAPSFFKEKLVFTSSRNTGKVTSFIHEWNDEPFSDIYATPVSTSSKHTANRLNGIVNSKFHESSTTFSPDLKTVYFTRNNFSNSKVKTNRQGHVLLKIYKATYNGKKWINIEELPFNSDEYSISHPALSPDGRFLYFASDMPGGYGQSDLYVVAIKEDGTFGKPKNLGNKINTKGRETFPYLSDTGRLYFASDGHKGLGGLDIFMATIGENRTLSIDNLGKPINSNKDDFTFIINEKNRIGYFASNRDGGEGSDDIYGVKQITSLPRQYQMLETKKKLERHVVIQEDTQVQPMITSF